MTQVDVQQLQADLPRYLEQVARGETLLVCREDTPVAEIRPVAAPPQAPRPIGLAKGTFAVPPSFFAPLPDDLLRAFEGEEG